MTGCSPRQSVAGLTVVIVGTVVTLIGGLLAHVTVEPAQLTITQLPFRHRFGAKSLSEEAWQSAHRSVWSRWQL